MFIQFHIKQIDLQELSLKASLRKKLFRYNHQHAEIRRTVFNSGNEFQPTQITEAKGLLAH